MFRGMLVRQTRLCSFESEARFSYLLENEDPAMKITFSFLQIMLFFSYVLQNKSSLEGYK